jgi:hypothetical protein
MAVTKRRGFEFIDNAISRSIIVKEFEDRYGVTAALVAVAPCREPRRRAMS